LAIQEDYLGPQPQYERNFEHIFRVTRGIVEKVMQVAANYDLFFTQRHFLTGEPGICPEAKVLIGLKQLAFGISCSGFVDYFQMGMTTGRICMKELAKAIANSPELREKYLRNMTTADTRRVSAMHEEEFGVPGCLGCLDCMHVFWRCCPTGWKGQFQGKEKGKASMVLEAVADYSLWFWHASFGTSGSCNDINIFDRSSLLRSMLDGTMTDELDFDFTIGDTVFNKLWFLVDGIYPNIACFVKTLSVPLGNVQKKYVKWQEGKRKAIERAFGVLQQKFQILTRPVELWYKEDIKDVVEACIILHNMMVEVRMSREEQEDKDFYDEFAQEDTTQEVMEQSEDSQRQRVTINRTHEQEAARGNDVPVLWPQVGDDARAEAIKTAMEIEFECRKERWDELYDEAAHFEIRDKIAVVVSKL
jgi:Plant transposon protein